MSRCSTIVRSADGAGQSPLPPADWIRKALERGRG